VVFPVLDPDIRRHILDWVMPSYLADNTKARHLGADGLYTRAPRDEGTARHRVQEEFLRHYTATPLEIPHPSPLPASAPGATGTARL